MLQTKIEDVHELRKRIVDKWDKLDQRIIDKVVRVAKETSSLLMCYFDGYTLDL